MRSRLKLRHHQWVIRHQQKTNHVDVQLSLYRGIASHRRSVVGFYLERLNLVLFGVFVFTHESSYCFQCVLAIAILSVRLFVCPSVCHTGGSGKNCPS